MPEADSLRVDRHDFKKRLNQFEENWQKGTPGRIEDSLPADADAIARRRLLEELVKIDLEYRWRVSKPTGGNLWLLEDYVARYPELGPLERLSVELIGEEYRARRRWGDRPSIAEYARRFSRHGPELHPVLLRVDSELAAEFGRGRIAMPDSAPVPPLAKPIEPAGQPVASVSSLLAALTQLSLLDTVQLHELASPDSQKHWPDAKSLAGELLKRGWLTPYQVNQLLQGRGAELALGPYVLLERLGEGGAGQVFKARHRKMDRVVALKIIRKELLSDAEAVGRFYREIQVVSRLDHPNVVHAYDAGPFTMPSPLGGEGGVRGHFLAMVFVEGTDLGKLVKQGGRMPVAQACEYIRQAACGLAHAHERGLVHRDIKPHNLIMSLREGLVKVADLGLARLPRAVNGEITAAITGVPSTGTLTPENAVLIGTADYLAPEQALNFHTADIRADIYSLGCTFYFLLSGQPPFPSSTLAEKLLKHQQAQPRPLREFRADVPSGLEAVLGKMLAKRPEDRYQTPAEVVAALESLRGERKPPRLGWPRWLDRKRIGMFARIGGVLLLLVLLFLLIRPFLGPGSPRDGNPDTLKELLVKGPSPLDQLNRQNVPAELPPQVVAALEDCGGGGAERNVRYVVFSPDGKRIASTPGHKVRLWDSTSAKTLLYSDVTTSASSVAFAPDCKTLAIGVNEGSVHLWDRGAKLDTLGKHEDRCTFVVFSPDGKTLASASATGSVKLFDVPSRREASLPGTGRVVGLMFAPKGETLAVKREGSLQAWDVAKGNEQKPPPIPSDAALLAYSANGQLLAGRQGQFGAGVWEAATGNAVNRFDAVSDPITSLAFLPDGKTLVLTRSLGSLLLWDFAPGKQPVLYCTLPRDIKTATLAPDGRHLAVVYENYQVHIVRLAPPPKN